MKSENRKKNIDKRDTFSVLYNIIDIYITDFTLRHQKHT
jgi:hypothetical protein